MRWPPWRKEAPPDMPAIGKAQADLERLRGQRGQVEELRRGYRQEFIRNHFGENVEKLFREVTR